MLAGIVDNEIYIKKESVRRFEIGRDKEVLEPACRMQNREKEEIAQFMLMPYWKNFFFFFATMKISYMKEKPGLLSERKIIISASTHTSARTLAFLLESWWNELALRRKRVEKKAAMTLPSAGERRVTSNQNSDEDWLVDGDVTCGMSKKEERERDIEQKEK